MRDSVEWNREEGRMKAERWALAAAPSRVSSLAHIKHNLLILIQLWNVKNQ